MDSILIAYHTGTGGTRMAAESMARQLEEKNMNVAVKRLMSGRLRGPDMEGDFDLLLLLYPVYAFRAPEPVLAWLENLPVCKDKPAAVISVSGGGEMIPNTACRVKVIKILEGKGYRVDYEDMLIMPSNIAIPTKAPLDKMLLDILPTKTERMVKAICERTPRRTHPHLVDRMLASMGSIEKHGAHRFGKRIGVTDSCNGCGICAEGCPTGNITMTASRPSFSKKCCLCMGCLYSCPTKSLKPGIGKTAMIKDGFDLNALAGTAAQEPLTEEQLKKAAPGVAWSAVRDYILDKQQH
jgi:ferredoxin/flavodoxin